MSSPSPAALPVAAQLESMLPPPDLRESLLYDRLASLGIAWRTHEHVPVFTVDEARTLRGSLPGVHTKNLFLEDRRRGLWLVVAREDLRVDLNELSRALGAPRFSFGKAELMVSKLGIAPGAVTPFCVMNAQAGSLCVILDEGMFGPDPLNFHPLRNDRTTAIQPQDLLKFIRSCGHEPRLAALPERT